jgi:hypothetical protein
MDLSVRRTSPLVIEDRSWLGDVDGTQATRSITLVTASFTAGTHYPDGVLKSGTVIARYGSGANVGLWGPYAGSASEVQSATVTGAPTGGTFTLTLNAETTAAIAYNATADTVRAALEGLPSLASGDVVVTGAAGGPYTVTFAGTKAGQNVAAMTATASLTGGSTPGVTIATVTAGGSTGTNGLDVPRGFLFNSIEMALGDANKGAPLQERGFIKPAKLPANSGLDAAARQILGNFFIFRD